MTFPSPQPEQSDEPKVANKAPLNDGGPFLAFCCYVQYQ